MKTPNSKDIKGPTVHEMSVGPINWLLFAEWQKTKDSDDVHLEVYMKDGYYYNEEIQKKWKEEMVEPYGDEYNTGKNNKCVVYRSVEVCAMKVDSKLEEFAEKFPMIIEQADYFQDLRKKGSGVGIYINDWHHKFDPPGYRELKQKIE
jgi:hypothetical protein